MFFVLSVTCDVLFQETEDDQTLLSAISTPSAPLRENFPDDADVKEKVGQQVGDLGGNLV